MKMNSIVFKMMLPLVITSVVVVGMTLVITQTYLRTVIEDIFVNQQVHHLKKIYNLKMENILSKTEQNGLTIANSQTIKKFVESSDAKNGKISDEMKKKLFDMKQLYHLDTIYIAEKSSRNYFNENGFVQVVNTSHKDNQWFLNTLKSKKRFLINADSDITGSLHIWSDAVIGEVNNPIGLAGCGVNIGNIYKMALEDFNKNSADVMILESSNMIEGISNNPKLSHVSLFKSNLPADKISSILSAQKNHQNLVKYRLKNEDRYVLLIPVTKLDWTIVIDFSKEKFLSSLDGVYDRIIIGGIILLILILIIGSWILTYLLSRPLTRISQAVSKFDLVSDFDATEFKNMGYEVDMICNAFKSSSKILRKTVDKHKYNEELLRNIINAAEDMIFFKDEELRYIGCNSAYEKWSLKTLDQIVGKTDQELYPLDIANLHIKIDKMVMKQNKTIITEEKFEKEDGSFVILQVKKSPFYDQDGNLKGLVVVARDMTLIKNMEHDL